MLDRGQQLRKFSIQLPSCFDCQGFPKVGQFSIIVDKEYDRNPQQEPNPLTT